MEFAEDGILYRGQVVKMGTSCYVIGVTKQIRKQIGKSFGDMVEVVLHERDSEKSPIWKCPKCGREFKKKEQSHYCGEKPKTIDEYILSQDEDKQEDLRNIRQILRSALPEAEERISWSMPTYWKGRCRVDKENCLVVLCNRKPCMRSNIMKQIEEIIRNTTEEEQEKVDWTKAWSTKYPVLATYQKEVDIPKYAVEIRRMFTELQADYNYSEQDAMLVLKDILAHEYMDNRSKKNKKHK